MWSYDWLGERCAAVNLDLICDYWLSWQSVTDVWQALPDLLLEVQGSRYVCSSASPCILNCLCTCRAFLTFSKYGRRRFSKLELNSSFDYFNYTHILTSIGNLQNFSYTTLWKVAVYGFHEEVLSSILLLSSAHVLYDPLALVCNKKQRSCVRFDGKQFPQRNKKKRWIVSM